MNKFKKISMLIICIFIVSSMLVSFADVNQEVNDQIAEEKTSVLEEETPVSEEKEAPVVESEEVEEEEAPVSEEKEAPVSEEKEAPVVESEEVEEEEAPVSEEKETPVVESDEVSEEETPVSEEKEVPAVESDEVEEEETPVLEEKEVPVVESDEVSEEETPVLEEKEVPVVESDDVSEEEAPVSEEKEVPALEAEQAPKEELPEVFEEKQLALQNEKMKNLEKAYVQTVQSSSYKENTGITSVVYLNEGKSNFAKDLMDGQLYFALSVETAGQDGFVVSDYKTSTGEAVTLDVIKETLNAFSKEHKIKDDIILNLDTKKIADDAVQSLKNIVEDIESITVLYDAKESVYQYDDIFRFEDGNNKVKGIHLEGRDTLILVREITRD